MSAVIIEPITLQMRGCTSSGGHSRLPDLLLLCGLSPRRIAAPLPVAQTRNLGARVVKGEEQAPLVGSLRISLVRPQKLHWARHMKRKGLLHSQALREARPSPARGPFGTGLSPAGGERGSWARAVAGGCGGGHG